MTRSLRIVQRNALVYRRVWRGSLFLSFLQPLLFLVSMGLGVGALVERGDGVFPGGVSFLAFLGPGLLASTCMQTATFEASFPIMAKMTWRRNYEAMSATPLRVVDIVFGEFLWIGARLLVVAAAFAAVLTAFGVAGGWRMLLAVPAAVLTGLAFAAGLMAYAATMKREGNNFNVVFRFVVTPLFLFSGVFFPVSQLPGWLRPVAVATPLYHGVELTRGLALQTIATGAAAGHAAYLVAVATIGVGAAIWTFSRRLQA